MLGVRGEIPCFLARSGTDGVFEGGEVTLELQPTTLLQVELEGSADSVRVCAEGGLERALTSRSEANDSWSDFLPPGTYRVEARRGNTRATTEVVLTGERNLEVTLALD